MFQLLDSIEPISRNNSTSQYSPKLKRFVPINKLPDYKIVAKIQLRGYSTRLDLIDNKIHHKLTNNIKNLHCNTYIHFCYFRRYHHHIYHIKVQALAIKFKEPQKEKRLIYGTY